MSGATAIGGAESAQEVLNRRKKEEDGLRPFRFDDWRSGRSLKAVFATRILYAKSIQEAAGNDDDGIVSAPQL